jgi:hypothetical protein
MQKTFCVTIDTEPDCDVHWNRAKPASFESVLVGIARVLRPLWDKYAVKPVYFVSPEVLADSNCCQVLKNEMGFGAEVGAHLHSEYIEPQRKHEDFAGTSSKEYPCFAYDSRTEYEKIQNLTQLIRAKLGTVPVSYRAARYGADLDTIESIEKLGYKVDSSVTPGIDWSGQDGPDHSRAPDQPYFISEDDYYCAGDSKILEVPITIRGKRFALLPDRWFFYRWLRPTHMTALEMRVLTDEFLRRYDNPVLNMMFHSMEVIPKRTPFVRTEFGRKMFLSRLERILQYLCGAGFRSRTLQEVYDEKLRQIS